MAARNYSSVARLASLTAGVSNSATTFPVDQTTGFPTAPFTLVVDPGRTAEEIVTVTAVVGLNLTVARGQDGTAAQPHDAAAELRHMATARDFREAAEHIDQTSGVHGTVGILVDTTSAQSLDNKTILAAGTDHVPLIIAAASGQTANLVNVNSSGGNTVASVAVTGRILTPGVDSSSTSTFTAGSAATVPLIVKGAASQSAKLISARDSASAEQFSVAADGDVTTNGTVQADAVVATSSTQANATVAGVTALAVRNTGTATTPVVAVQNAAGATTAGFGTEANGFQLFHGGSTNLVPFRMHGGIQSVTMETGASSWGGTIDISSYGFTQVPIVQLSVRQNNGSLLKRRVCVNIENAVTTSAIGFRVVQTNNEDQISNETYYVNWVAIQFTPSSGAG